jgi:Conserved domain frequently associated with peptide methionine sulfoxide reductase
MYGGRITSEEKSTFSMYFGLVLLCVLGAGAVYFFFLTQETKPLVGFDPNRPVESDTILKRRLKAEQYRVVRGNGTQTSFQNEFWDNTRAGIYVDIITNEPLFTSVDKYDAGVGMPTFSKPISYDLLVEVPDNSTTWSGSRCALNEATPTWATSLAIRNRRLGEVTPSIRLPSISFR